MRWGRRITISSIMTSIKAKPAGIVQPVLSFPCSWNQSFEEIGYTPSILIVDDLEINRRLLKAMLKNTSYRFLEARGAEEAFRILARERIDLVVLDLMIPGMSGTEFCRQIKAERRTQLVPVLMMTSLQGVENEIHGIDSGADEYLTKPLHPALVRARVRAMLRNKASVDSLEEAETILFALAQAVESRDEYTAGHCERLATYSVAVGVTLGLSKPELVALHRGGFLHDIGKVAVPDRILHGTGKLSQEEWTIMKRHTIRGEEICQPMKSLAPVLPIIRSHHERWDGSGYPDGLAGEDIPLLARVLQVVDIYDALTTKRTYKPTMSHHDAIQLMQEESDKGWRDPDLISLFVSVSNSSWEEGIAEFASPEWSELQSMRESLQNMQHSIGR